MKNIKKETNLKIKKEIIKRKFKWFYIPIKVQFCAYL